MAYEIKTTYFGAMPNQAEGTLNGKPFYFRARWGSWCLRYLTDTGEISGGEVIDYGDGDVVGGESPGWWPEEGTRKFVTELLERHSK